MSLSWRCVVRLCALMPLVGCGANPDATRSNADPQDHTWHSKAVYQGILATLIPLQVKDSDKVEAAEVVWRDLYPGMAGDPETKKLLARLYGATTATLVVLKKPPGDGYQPDFAPQQPTEAFLALWHLPGSVRLRDENAEPGVPASLLSVTLHMASFKAGPTVRGSYEVDATFLICNDYLLRHRKGYYLHHGFGSPTDPKIEVIAKGSIEELRVELDRKIEAWPPKSK